jgi:hypothetical protein
MVHREFVRHLQMMAKSSVSMTSKGGNTESTYVDDVAAAGGVGLVCACSRVVK